MDSKMLIKLSENLYTPAFNALWEVFCGICKSLRLDPDVLYYETTDGFFYTVDYEHCRIIAFSSDEQDYHTGEWRNYKERVMLDDRQAFLCVTGLMSAMKYIRETQK